MWLYRGGRRGGGGVELYIGTAGHLFFFFLSFYFFCLWSLFLLSFSCLCRLFWGVEEEVVLNSRQHVGGVVCYAGWGESIIIERIWIQDDLLSL